MSVYQQRHDAGKAGICYENLDDVAALRLLLAAAAPPETRVAVWADAVAVVEALREPLPSGDYARGRSHMHAEILAAFRDQARHG